LGISFGRLNISDSRGFSTGGDIFWQFL